MKTDGTLRFTDDQIARVSAKAGMSPAKVRLTLQAMLHELRKGLLGAGFVNEAGYSDAELWQVVLMAHEMFGEGK